MKFLLHTGGDIDPVFGVLTTPAHYGIVKGIQDGKPWAADNQAFTQGFDPEKFLGNRILWCFSTLYILLALV